MHEETLKEIVTELEEFLPERFLGRIFQLSAQSLALDFGLKQQGYLFISIEPAAPRLYLIKRTVRELEKSSVPLSSFAQAVKTTLGGGALLSLAKDEDERIVRFFFVVEDEVGDSHKHVLVAQLTGRSANLFLLDSEARILQAWRHIRGEGQQLGDAYRPPIVQEKTAAAKPRKPESETLVAREGSAKPSESADKHYREIEARQGFDRLAENLLAGLRKEITKRKKLQANLRKDLIAHGNPDDHKRLGDLLLANIANANRAGNRVTLTDYYAEGAPSIEVEIDENATLPEAANGYFTRYAKAKRAVEEIGKRLRELGQEVEELDQKLLRLEGAIGGRDLAALENFTELKIVSPARKKQKAPETLPGLRRYLSSDGYEVLVGRTARDNDRLTFHVAKPNDLWLHAGDYPGSHVIVRNQGRNEIPHRTVIEAAQLAAKFSQASKDSKVNIHYTRRKFLTKPKGAAPGLVRLSNFKTITVAPGENLKRIL